MLRCCLCARASNEDYLQDIVCPVLALDEQIAPRGLGHLHPHPVVASTVDDDITREDDVMHTENGAGEAEPHVQ